MTPQSTEKTWREKAWREKITLAVITGPISGAARALVSWTLDQLS